MRRGARDRAHPQTHVRGARGAQHFSGASPSSSSSTSSSSSATNGAVTLPREGAYEGP